MIARLLWRSPGRILFVESVCVIRQSSLSVVAASGSRKSPGERLVATIFSNYIALREIRVMVD